MKEENRLSCNYKIGVSQLSSRIASCSATTTAPCLPIYLLRIYSNFFDMVQLVLNYATTYGWKHSVHIIPAWMMNVVRTWPRLISCGVQALLLSSPTLAWEISCSKMLGPQCFRTREKLEQWRPWPWRHTFGWTFAFHIRLERRKGSGLGGRQPPEQSLYFSWLYGSAVVCSAKIYQANCTN